MAKNSHVQLPRSVLQQFADPSGRVFYLNLETGHIGMTGPRKLGTELGYYSDAFEEYLSKEIESPFGSLAERVRNFIKPGTDTLVLPKEEETVLKRYVTAAMSRSKLAEEAFHQSSYTASFCTPQSNHDALVGFSIHHNGGVAELFEDHFMIILENKTDVNFVIPRNCFYTLPSGGKECIVVPLSPVCALCLCPVDYDEIVSTSKEHRLGHVSTAEEVWRMNVRALSYEYAFNKAFIASATKPELESLSVFLKQNRSLLEKQRNDIRG